MTAELSIRRARPGDDVLAVIRGAFAEEAEQIAPLWAELEQSDALRASLVAEQDGAVVGHVGLSHAWLDARRELVDVWLLSPLGVVPELQGRGIGSRLLAAAVEEARAGDTPLLLLEGDPGYYGARGFTRAGEYGVLPPSARTPEAAFQLVRFAGYEDWMAGQVIYRDVWWRHDCAGLRDPMLAEIEERLR